MRQTFHSTVILLVAVTTMTACAPDAEVREPDSPVQEAAEDAGQVAGDTGNRDISGDAADARTDDGASGGGDTGGTADDGAGDNGTAGDDATGSDVIPSPYVGRWDADADACDDASSVMRLIVSSGELRFYEGHSRVLAVTADDAGVMVEAEHQAEGTTERRTFRLGLNDAGDRLTVTTDLSSAARVRCD